MRQKSGFGKIIIVLVFLFIMSAFVSESAPACTLWSAAGDAVENGGTILGKTRDWSPSHNTIRTWGRKGQYKYMGIAGEENGKSTGVKAGVNEKGLSVVSSTASSVPRKERRFPTRLHFSINSLILSSYASVDEVLKDRKIFSMHKPCNFMISDRERIAVIEVAPGGEVFIREEKNGVLYHANHYFLDKGFDKFNTGNSKSSSTRLKRVEELLNTMKKPFTLDEFKTISSDQNAGPDDSIWRTGSTPKKSRTLAVFLVRIPPQGAPVVYIKTANPDNPVKEYTFELDRNFWKKDLKIK